MATKTQVVNRTKKLGGTIEITSREVVVSMPDGLTMDHKHYSAYEFASFETKADVWTMLFDELKLIRECSCGCGNLD
jgi:hypothetical protein